MKAAYRTAAAQNKTKAFRRRHDAEDPSTHVLNVGGGIMYGVAASACAALGLSPALGIIHRGNVRSLAHDLADLFKVTVTIPTAFRVGSRKPDNLVQTFRRELREQMGRHEVLETMVSTLRKSFRHTWTAEMRWRGTLTG